MPYIARDQVLTAALHAGRRIVYVERGAVCAVVATLSETRRRVIHFASFQSLLL
jgi:BarA-like signal transduction histidine kinase